MTKLNDLERVRYEKMERMQEAGMDPYPRRVNRTHTTKEALSAYTAAPEGDQIAVTVIGRIRSIRSMGKVVFAHIEDEAGRLQLFLRADDVGSDNIECKLLLHLTRKRLVAANTG